jgi:uncharacterized surface protein with fasciclin (FAS1) repeats
MPSFTPSITAGAVRHSHYEDMLANFADAAAGPCTVFAPTNTAFEDLAEAFEVTVGDLLGLEDVGDILLYHVVPGAYLAADVFAAAPFDAPTLLESEAIAIDVVDGAVVLNETVTVVEADLIASNGVIHAIDGVLTIPTQAQ